MFTYIKENREEGAFDETSNNKRNNGSVSRSRVNRISIK